MKISVVTAVYNRKDTIGQAVASISAQEYHNIEHIIQDGGSTDGTLNIIKQAAPAALLVSEHDMGIYDAINKGISRASGDIVGLMHSDDFFADNSVLNRVAALMENSDIDGVYADLDYVSAANPDKIIRQWVAKKFQTGMLASGWMPPHPTLYLRRSVFEHYGSYDTDFQIAADYEATLRYLTSGIRLAYDPNVAVKMRVGGESNASVAKIIRKTLEDYKAIRRHKIGGFGTLLRKNIGKINQFLPRNYS